MCLTVKRVVSLSTVNRSSFVYTSANTSSQPHRVARQHQSVRYPADVTTYFSEKAVRGCYWIGHVFLNFVNFINIVAFNSAKRKPIRIPPEMHCKINAIIRRAIVNWKPRLDRCSTAVYIDYACRYWEQTFSTLWCFFIRCVTCRCWWVHWLLIQDILFVVSSVRPFSPWHPCRPSVSIDHFRMIDTTFAVQVTTRMKICHLLVSVSKSWKSRT